MGEYSSSFGNVGEPGSACRAGRIPEEGAQRLTSLDWVLGAGLLFCAFVYLPEPGRRGQIIFHNLFPFHLHCYRLLFLHRCHIHQYMF